MTERNDQNYPEQDGFQDQPLKKTPEDTRSPMQSEEPNPELDWLSAEQANEAEYEDPISPPIEKPSEPSEPAPQWHTTKEPQPTTPPVEEASSWSYSPNPQNGANDFNAPYRTPKPDQYRWNFGEYQQMEQHGQQKKKNIGLKIFGIAVALVFGVSILFFAGMGAFYVFSDDDGEMDENGMYLPNQSDSPKISITDPPEGSNTPVITDGPLSTKEIIKRVKPSVVGIESYTNNSFAPTNAGSGIILDESGYIITNAHVVAGSTGISVILDNGESYFAKLIGSDTKTDLAVIKIEASGLIAATFGNSDLLEDGDRVVAIGNPGGMQLGGTTTQGIVSSAKRSFKSNSGYSTTYIQTDAAINPGNSGGPLINEFGQVIGINSAKIVAEGYEGIGFAIPINEAKPIIDQLIESGHVQGRSKLGITGTEISELVSIRDGIPRGIAIYSIEPSSDLAGKNVAKNDILIGIDDTMIETFDDVSNFLKAKQPGQTVTLHLYRPSTRGAAGSEYSIDIKLIPDIEQ